MRCALSGRPRRWSGRRAEHLYQQKHQRLFPWDSSTISGQRPRLRAWNRADELSRHDDALGVSCARAARLLDVAGGPHRDAATGRVYALDENLEEFRLLREGFRRALRVAPRRAEPAACGLPRAPPFAPPLDAPATAGGRVCVLAVATALFGAVDALEPLADAERKRAQLDRYENDLGLASCWFAFVDGAAFEALADAAGAAPAARACGRLAYGRYDVVRVPEKLMPFADAGPNSRVPKMLGHLFLSHARYLLYMDAKIRLGALEDAWTLLYEELVPVPNSNLQLDFNVSVCEYFDTSSSTVLRELDESNRSVQKSAESTSI